MQPFDLLGLPSPDECLGMAGLLVSVLAAIAGIAWLTLFRGGTLAFALVAVSVVLGISSFMYCETWGMPESESESE